MNAQLLLVIDHRDTQLTLDGGALRLATPGNKPRHIPLGVLGLVVVHGRALVGCDVWRALAERGIPAVLQPGRGRGACAWMGPALGATVGLRIAQHRAAEQETARLAIARRLLHAKLEAQLCLSKSLTIPAALAEAHAALCRSQREALAQIPAASSRDTLMGLEGVSAAAWFRWLGRSLAPAWGFHGRNRRPPRDPVNALFSLGYTLLGGEMLGTVQQHGLDPAQGLLHELVPGRESLVLDLIEPLRPSVDLVVLGMLDRLLKPEDFTSSPSEGCRLSKEARGRFYQAWAQARQDWPDLHPSLEEARSGTTVSLSQLCRRQMTALRQDLRPFMPFGEAYEVLEEVR
ncbi:CRISPR-associated endonuclease Cas1 [Allochromatium palmeri]|uniref:CRISPR-associated endonuclease Cas1 n=1 Tax=Allochromatium palmeri TaxID=231048 RepID=A0A6N8EFY2_9GAMM|nr:CRISPR-associated endonuclease Cas1 [Allochromatium palmeri]MTW23133.1 CRISPR-associated endonuclease Cas1 [Allochromatium palmeri]